MSGQSEEIRTMVRGAYDVQKLRIQMGNRIVGNFKAKLGQDPGRPEDELDAQGRKILKELRQEYSKIMDGLKRFPQPKRFKGTEVISTYTELSLMAQYVELEAVEKAHFRRLDNVLFEYAIYRDFLVGVRGVGPAMAGVIISEIDIYKAQYPSSLWKYAGLDVVITEEIDDYGELIGQGRSRRREHLVKVKYIDKEGKEKERDSITYNPWLKTKLVKVLGTSFLRTKDCHYRQCYDDYKYRLEHSQKHKDKTKLHRHNMAMRYMVKRFLADLYKVWRRLEGLPVELEYSEAKLGNVHRLAG